MKSELRDFSLRVVRTNDVKSESGDLVKHVLKDDELKYLSGKMLSEQFMKPEMV